MDQTLPKLDYANPQPRVRPKWLDILLLWLAGLAGVVVMLVPIWATFLIFPDGAANRWLNRIYLCAVVVGVIVGIRYVRRFGQRRI